LGTSLFGHTEFGVRIGAEASWLAALLFVYGYARNLLGKSEGLRAAMLLAALPFFFLSGFFMMPDSPLVACWAGALYFLERALLGDRRSAWWGAGACMGLGLLSKYPMALVGASALAFVLIDRPSRRWLLRPEPYLAALLAALVFSPVLLWNAEHAWASFRFQGASRWRHSPRFELPELIGSAILLITPLGLWGFFSSFRRRSPASRGRGGGLEERGRTFVWVFTLLPLAVFAWASLRNETKLNWTGPLWLGALPAIALSLSGSEGSPGRRWIAAVDRLWKPMLVALLPAYGAALHFPVLGLPGVPYPENYYGMSWRDLGRQVEAIELEVIQRTGAEPLMVGMDKYHLSSV
ncbi:MAG: glycosyltransferase family 39 protein, partial [Candidatus Methylomirabilales bacterium]